MTATYLPHCHHTNKKLANIYTISNLSKGHITYHQKYDGKIREENTRPNKLGNKLSTQFRSEDYIETKMKLLTLILIIFAFKEYKMVTLKRGGAHSVTVIIIGTIYPTPPLGQDMTQGQYLSGV